MNKRILSFLVALSFMLLTIVPAAAQDAVPFPVTVEHKFGTTTIEQEPQRVVAIGYTEQDYLLALGITPVAVRYWYGEEDAILPWAEDQVEGEAPIVLNMPFGSLNYEAILALEPDLISAVTAGITQEEYDLLSQIAPTIAQSEGYIDFGMPWQEITHMVGMAVGRSDEAEAITANVESLFAAVREENPQFAGKTVAVSYFFDGTYGFYTPQDTRGRFFTDLGFVVPDELVAIAGDSFFANVSAESIALIDQDVIALVNLQFIEGGREALEAEPLFGSLNAVQEDRVIYLDEAAENALGFSSPLSLPFALEAALPQLRVIFPPSVTAVATCEAGFRLFDHDLLATEPICIPNAPQRIVTLETYSFEAMIALGVPQSGTLSLAKSFFVGNFPDLAAQVEMIPDVGFPPNLESILALEPDLILGASLPFITDIYDELSTIAPVALARIDSSGDWQSAQRFFADAVNAPAAMNALFTGYQERLDQFASVMGENAGDIEVSIVRVRAEGIAIPGASLYAGTIIGEAGLSRPEAQIPLDGTALSIEQIPLADGDVIFAWLQEANPQSLSDAQTLLTMLETNPLWSQLDAVQSEQVYEVGSYWIGYGFVAAHHVLDDLFTSIAGVDPARVSPNPFLDTTSVTSTTFEPIPGFPAFTAVSTMFDIIEDRGDTLLVRHLMGETEIPADPQRLYTDASTTQIALSLGLPVVGAQYFTNLLNIPDLAPLLGGVTELGTNTYQANFEAILAQQPDLILVWANVATNPEAQSVYDALSQIAPTVVLNGNPFTYWQQTTRVLGDALGRATEADALIADYTVRSAALCERIRTVIGDETVTIFDVFDGAIRVIGAAAATPDGSVIPPAFTSWAYVDCGLIPGEEVARLTNGGFSASVSLESLSELGADYLIAYTNVASPDAEQVYQSFTESPLWALLPAVQNDRVYRVDVLDASGYFSALYVLERVADVVSGE